MTNYNERLDISPYSNCCGANDIYDGNLGNNEGVCLHIVTGKQIGRAHV